MKKAIKKVLSVMLVVVIMLTAAPLSGFVGLELPEWLNFSIKSSAAETSGTCGENLTWTFNKETNILTISGSGAMYDYSVYYGNRPWEDYTDLIYEIIIGNNVTSVGGEAFMGFPGLCAVVIGKSVTSIGKYACASSPLSHVSIPKSVKTISEGAFACDFDYLNVYYSGTQKEWSQIKIGLDNDDLLNATYYFDSTICEGLTHIARDSYVENVVNSTCFATGSYDEVVYCTVCGTEISRKTVLVPMVGHTKEKIPAVDATCTATGSTEGIKCSVCDVVITAPTIVPKVGHTLVNGVCTVCGWGDVHKDYENVTVKYKDKGSITLNFKQNWFKKDSKYYNHDIATLCSQFVTLGYDTKSLKSHLKSIGFNENAFWEIDAKESQVDNFIAHRKVTVNGEIYTLLFVGCIGTNTVQWYSNFKPGKGITHASFNSAKNYVYGNIVDYIDEYKIDTSKTKILLCGHSRGAATVNLLAAQLIDEQKFATQENIYTYTFATPNPTSSSKTKDSKYSRIFNIVNPEDFVTKVLPAQWKYGRYGTTYVLPSKTNTSNYKNIKSNMQSYFSKLTGEKYTPFKNGEQETYKIVNKFTSTVKSVNDFYEKGMRGSITDNDMKPYEFFQKCICPLVGAEVGSDDFINGLVAFVGVLVDPTTCETYKEFTQYFFENAVLDRLNKMTPDLLKIVLPIIQPVLGGAISTVLATSEGYFEDSHRAETYCAYMMSMTASQVTAYRSGYKNTVNCPVDIEVYDKTTGELVGRIVNNTVDEEIAAMEKSIVMAVDGDSKSFWLPSDGEYEVKLIGNDDGTMDYTVAEVDGDSVETARVNFVNVEITDNKSMSGDFTGEDFALEEYSLTTEDGKTIESDDLITSDNVDEYKFDVAISTIGTGFATGDGTYTKGDYVTVSASTDELNEFLGWYENGELVSIEVDYSFVVHNNVELTAKFTNYEYEFFIQEPSRTEIRHKDGIKLHANIEGTAPAGSYIEWTASNGKFKTEEINNGNSLKIVSDSNGKTTFTATLYSADGEVLATDTIEMKSKAGFFDKIGSFFRSIFGGTKIYDK